MKKILIIILMLFCSNHFIYSQYYGIVHNFGGFGDGAAPYGSLMVSDSIFYGMTSGGGSYKSGIVFKMDLYGGSYSILHSFDGSDTGGSTPNGRLLKIGNSLYGLSFYGGEFNLGTIFKINTDGTGFKILHSFGEIFDDGASPYGSLIQLGDTLYGMTFNGGFDNRGTIFKIDIDGSGFAIQHSFTDNPQDGSHPGGTLISSGGVFYGMTSRGGDNNAGTIFQINPDGSGFAILHSFNGSGPDSDGSSPSGSLLLADSVFYGMNYFGGPDYNGTIFKMKMNGSGFSVMHSFLGNSSDGSGGYTLIRDKSLLYGVSIFGGLKLSGTIFSIDTNGRDYTILHSFEGSPNDARNAPLHEGLLLYNNSLYGMSVNGGTSDSGTVFSYQIQPVNTIKDSCDSNFVEYSDFSNSKDIAFNSASKLNNSEIRITPALNNKTGSIFYKIPFDVSNGFSTEFSFRFSNGYNDVPDGSPEGADGIAFVIQANNYDYYGKTGGGLGYSGIPNSLAIEFDSYNDDNDLHDPDGSHVAVFSNGKNPNSSDHKSSAFIASTSDIPLLKADSTIYHGKIEYFSKEKRLSIYFDTTGKFKYAVLVIDSISLTTKLNLINGTKAFIGFTSATGTSYENTDLLNWSFCTKKRTGIQSEVEQTSQFVSNDLAISPNPVSDYLTVKAENITDKIEIYSLPGECVFFEQTPTSVPNSVHKIDVSKLSSGVYLIKAGNQSRMFIKY